MRVLVTGAAGFIGRRIVSRLGESADIEVLAGVRATHVDSPVPTIVADVTDGASLDRALEGVDAVVHTAVGDETVTVDGTRTLLAAATRHDVRRIVHLSSIAVYGSATGVVTEETPFARDADGYAAWKIAAEEAALASALPVVRLRPTIVYGAGSELWIDSTLRRLRSGRWGTIGSLGEGTCNPVHVDDVAAAVESALRAEATGAYNVNGPEALSWNDWFRRLSRAAGLGEPPAIPPGVVRRRMLTALPLRAARKAVPSFDPPALLGAPAPSELALFGLRATYPTDAATRALGWSPTVELDEGLARTLRTR